MTLTQVPLGAAAGQSLGAAPPANRMAIAVLALVGIIIAVYMSLYKMGVMPAIACGTGSCETVQNSPWAVFLGVPVPYIGVSGYGAIFALAMLGVQPGRQIDRRIGIALVALTFVALAFSAWLSWVEAVLIGAWCRWCIASAVVAALLFLAALPELTRLVPGKDRP